MNQHAFHFLVCYKKAHGRCCLSTSLGCSCDRMSIGVMGEVACLCSSMSHTFAHTRSHFPQNSPSSTTLSKQLLRTMLPCLSSAVVLGVLQVAWITAAMGTCPPPRLQDQLKNLIKYLNLSSSVSDTGSFLIFNENHMKCIRVETPTSITVAQCDPNNKNQQFRWASESRVLSMKLQLCLAATDVKDWVKVVLVECDESSQLQHWECKNDTLFGLKDQDLHLNWGNKNERNIMVYKGSGLWSRWRIYGTKNDLCSKGFQGKTRGHVGYSIKINGKFNY